MHRHVAVLSFAAAAVIVLKDIVRLHLRRYASIAFAAVRHSICRRIPRTQQFQWLQQRIVEGWPENASDLVEFSSRVSCSFTEFRLLAPLVWQKLAVGLEKCLVDPVVDFLRALQRKYGTHTPSSQY